MDSPEIGDSISSSFFLFMVALETQRINQAFYQFTERLERERENFHVRTHCLS
jgi:hypothetical protein